MKFSIIETKRLDEVPTGDETQTARGHCSASAGVSELGGPPGAGPSREAASEMVLTLLRVCKIRKSCKLDLPVVTRRNRLSQGEKTAGDADWNQKLTGNKQRANRKERVPLTSSRCLVSLVPPTGKVLHSRWAKRKWFSESQPQNHKAQKRGMDLKPRDNK